MPVSDATIPKRPKRPLVVSVLLSTSAVLSQFAGYLAHINPVGWL